MTSLSPQDMAQQANRTSAVPVPQQLALLGALLLLLLGGAITPKLLAWVQGSEPDTTATAHTTSTTPNTTDTNHTTATADYFSELDLTAEAVFVYDVVREETLFSREPNTQLPLASITKLMTAMVAHELLQEDSSVIIDEAAIRQDGFSSLLRDEQFARKPLTDLVLISSTNDGAYALATAAGSTLNDEAPANAFVRAMNARSEELGFTEMFFTNPSGLDISTTQSGGYGTAREVTMLMRHILTEYPELLTATAERSISVTSEDGYSHDGTNTNYYLDEIPGLIGSKTGYTDLAGGNLVVAFNAGLNRPVIITVLGSTRHDRFTDVVKLVDAATLHIASQQ